MIKGPKGCPDILPDKTESLYIVISSIRKIVESFGYREIITPIFEHREIFERSVGENTDIVEKEMYTFKDKGGRDLSLRPEGTASVMRAYIEHGMKSLPQPVKLYYFGPMFRYERPQKGRQRQFFHFGIEALGDESPYLDVEVIDLALIILRKLGLKDLSVKINSIGCKRCRPKYREALREYLKPRYEKLCDDCKRRFYSNPLRILDCKKESCKRETEEAPRIIDFLCDECKGHFKKVLELLDILGVRYEIDNRLVRGLDYYTRTVFEVQSGDLGSQNAVLGGGRYDDLSESMGGKKTPGVGFAIGIERLMILLEKTGNLPYRKRKTIYILPISEADYIDAFKLYMDLGEEGNSVFIPYKSKKLKSGITDAVKRGASYLIIVGGEEKKRGNVILRDLSKKVQEEISFMDIKERIKQLEERNGEE